MGRHCCQGVISPGGGKKQEHTGPMWLLLICVRSKPGVRTHMPRLRGPEIECAVGVPVRVEVRHSISCMYTSAGELWDERSQGVWICVERGVWCAADVFYLMSRAYSECWGCDVTVCAHVSATGRPCGQGLSNFLRSFVSGSWHHGEQFVSLRSGRYNALRGVCAPPRSRALVWVVPSFFRPWTIKSRRSSRSYNAQTGLSQFFPWS